MIKEIYQIEEYDSLYDDWYVVITCATKEIAEREAAKMRVENSNNRKEYYVTPIDFVEE